MNQLELGKVLEHLMEEANITCTELARRTEIPQPTLHRILTGATRSPRGESLRPLANYFSITINQLLGDNPLPKDRIPGTHNLNVTGWQSIPIITWEQASQWPKAKEELHGTKWDKWTTTELAASSDTYSLIMTGDAMAPRFMEGTILIVNPTLEPKDRDFVVVRLKGQNSVTFKQLLLDGNDKYLKPLNPEFQTQLLEKGYKFMGVMIQAKMNYR